MTEDKIVQNDGAIAAAAEIVATYSETLGSPWDECNP